MLKSVQNTFFSLPKYGQKNCQMTTSVRDSVIEIEIHSSLNSHVSQSTNHVPFSHCSQLCNQHAHWRYLWNAHNHILLIDYYCMLRYCCVIGNGVSKYITEPPSTAFTNKILTTRIGIPTLTAILFTLFKT